VKSGLETYLRLAPNLCRDGHDIKEVAEKLVEKIECPNQRAHRLFEFVRDEVAYTMKFQLRSIEDLSGNTALNARKGFCIQKATLLASLGRAVGIPTQVCFQDIINHDLDPELSAYLGNVLAPHGLCSFYLDGKWVKLDPTYPKNTCLQSGWRVAEFDSEKGALLPAKKLDGSLHITITRDWGCYPDIPEIVYKAIIESFWYKDLYHFWEILDRC